MTKLELKRLKLESLRKKAQWAEDDIFGAALKDRIRALESEIADWGGLEAGQEKTAEKIRGLLEQDSPFFEEGKK